MYDRSRFAGFRQWKGSFETGTKRGLYPNRNARPIKAHEKPFTMKTHEGKKETHSWPAAPTYTIDIDYNSTTHKAEGTLEVSFKNNIKNNLSELYFNLWGNADVFKENGGGMNVSDVKVNGEDSTFEVNDTAMHIKGISFSQK